MKVYLSLSALPSRERVTKVVLQNLLHQTLAPSRIFIHVCPFYRRVGQQLPSDYLFEFRSDPRIVFVPSQDEGPATKFLSSASLPRERGDILIFCDDDVAYPLDSLERLVQFLKSRSKVAVGFLGRVLGTSLNFNRGTRVFDRRVSRNNRLEVDVLMAAGMLALRSEDLPFDLKQRWERAISEGPSESIRLTDDIFLNSVLSSLGIRRYVIPGWIDCKRFAVSDPLWALNRNGQNNNLALEYFRTHFLPVAHGPFKRISLNALHRFRKV